MVEGWEWDETLFAGTAAHYARGRIPYAPGLADALAEALQLDGSGRLLDVGCGPGTLALELAHLFAEVVGVDADAAMIAEAERAAERHGLARRAGWVCLRAEQLPAGLGTFDIAVFAQSFHWMDRDLVAATVRDMLRPGGTIVHLGGGTAATGPGSEEPLSYPAVPNAAIDALVRRRLGPVRRAGRGVLMHGTPGGETQVYARAGLLGPRRVVVPGGAVLVRSADEVVAGVLSMSSSAPHLFGDGLGHFEAQLRQVLHEASPSGRFAVRQPSSEAVLWRVPER